MYIVQYTLIEIFFINPAKVIITKTEIMSRDFFFTVHSCCPAYNGDTFSIFNIQYSQRSGLPGAEVYRDEK